MLKMGVINYKQHVNLIAVKIWKTLKNKVILIKKYPLYTQQYINETVLPIYVLYIKMLTCNPNLTSGDGVTSEVGEESAAREAVGVLYADEGGMPSSPAPPPPLAEASLLVGVSPPPSPPDAAPAPRLPRLKCHQSGNLTSKVYNIQPHCNQTDNFVPKDAFPT